MWWPLKSYYGQMRLSEMPLWVVFLGVVCHAAGDIMVGDISCDFEEPFNCTWSWNATSPNGITIVDAAEIRQNVHYRGPLFDASNHVKGKFLYIEMTPGSRELHVWSERLSHTRVHCQLHVSLAFANMSSGTFKVVVDTSNTSWVVEEKPGNDRNSWARHVIIIGRVKQEFRIILEVSPGKKFPAHLLIDNIKLVDCFPDAPSYLPCSRNLFHCSKESDEFCINKTQVCDIVQDCWNGDDEKQDCDKVPEFARCTFEDGWCGWENSPTSVINWTRQNGTSQRRITGPAYDHTFQNLSGMFLYVNMSTVPTTKLGQSAVLESSLIHPPPRFLPNSTYYRSCYIRFFYHQFGLHSASLGLFLNEKDSTNDKVIRLWFTYGDKGDRWHRQIVEIPSNISNKYMLQFEARRGLRARGDVAIDDVSLSPECFGINVPPNETGGYDYDTFTGFTEPTKPVAVYRDFMNKSVFIFTSCGAKGQFGPTPENCSEAYNNTNTNVTVLQDPTSMGVQRWTVPEDGYYTIVAKGASGGKGANGRGVSKAATAVGVTWLKKSENLFIIVGQEGGSACYKNFAFTQSNSCGMSQKNERRKSLDPLKELQGIDFVREGGGGGGASAVFLWSRLKGRIPLIIGAGGGGLGGGHSIEDGVQHGQSMDKNRQGITGNESPGMTAGAGGGWDESKNGTLRLVTGQSITMGAQGGQPCGKVYDPNHSAGGFGGGGGGCETGGSAGGYAGGPAVPDGTTDGHGGFSYVSPLIVKHATKTLAASSIGPGGVIIIPATRGCGCEFMCAAFDEHRASTVCICATDFVLNEDGHTCDAVSIPDEDHSDRILAVFATMVMILFCCLVALFSYKHYRHRQKKKAALRMNKVNESDLQLNRLRGASDHMLTEFNPNYEFGGGTFTTRDLTEVPRESLRLVKALGQGAFGEVYQGFYRYRTGDAVEMPVAVKTLPELSTNQAETDFLMEALIMSKFNHPNIVHFIGVCFDRHPRLIVLELLAGGDLKNFLRESRPKPERPSPLNMKDLLTCAVDVAKGCYYLEENRFIHRDIAARNCLLTTKGPGRTCKIADFGMSRDIYRSDYYRKGGKAMLPIKWMPPEAFQDGIFTSKTDVWSFGVLLWEVMSLGYMPYTGCGNREVMQLVISGGRLEPPCNCPEPVYAIMTKCWHPKPEERPTFKILIERLGYCVQDPEVLDVPLPIFNRLTWTDRETAGTQSEAGSSTHRGSNDYLEPNMGFVTPESINSTEDGWRSNVSSEQSTLESLLPESGSSRASDMLARRGNRRPLTATLSLDASSLAKQPVPYVKHHLGMANDVNAAPTALPYTVPANGRIPNESEISC